MMRLFCCALALCSMSVFAAPKIVKLDYPASVKAGEEFKLTVTADGGDAKSVSYTFNGETKTAPGGLVFLRAADLATKGSEVAGDPSALSGKTVAAKTNYHALMHVPFPQDGKKYTVWVRFAGGNLCLRRPDKELKWLWKAPAELKWVNAGEFSSETVGKTLGFMGSKAPYPRIDSVILTTVSAKEFKPSETSSAANVFTWKPDASAVGKHELTVTVQADGASAEAKVAFEVVAGAAGAGQGAFRIPSERQLDLTPGKLNAMGKIKEYPLFGFFNAEFRKAANDNPFGLTFRTDYLLPLKCNAYNNLPDTVEFEVNKRVGGFAMLFTEYWQGEVNQEMAHLKVCYEDGTSARIPLREEVELCGSLRNRDPQGAFFSGVINSESIEYHLTVVPWVNPHPDKLIKSVVFSNIRTVFSKEENKDIPLNVTSVSSQILLSLTGLADRSDAEKLLAAAVRPKSADGAQAGVTIDFGRVEGAINPFVYSTNESGVMSGHTPEFDDYLTTMKEIDCQIFRFHSGWNLKAVYPNKLDNPNYQPLITTIRKMKAVNPKWEIMMCFNRIPDYVDPKTPEGRKLFATLAADLVRELNIKQKLGVKYWEIYNEVYFRKIDEDRALWLMYNETAKAIRKVDPSVKIGGYAPCWPVLGNIRDFYKHCYENTDFISYHKYLTGSVSTTTDYLMSQTASFGDDASRIRAIADKITPGKKIELALTEYNINFNWKPHDPRQADHIGAAWLASVLNHLIRNKVEIAQTWHSRGGGTFGLISKDGEIRPMAKVLAVCNKYVLGDFVRSQSSVRKVEALGFRNAKAAGFLLINKSATPMDVNISLLNAPAFETGRIFPAGEAFSVTEAGFAATRGELPKQVKLAPYETMVFVNPIQKK